jgi:hypothetical protein
MTTTVPIESIVSKIVFIREDFMFQVTGEEAEVLRCQTGISKPGRGGRRYLPYVFTEQGVAMLSSYSPTHGAA